MSKFLHIVLLLCVLMPLELFAQDDEVKANVAISVQQNQKIWAGQQVTLNLDLKTTGFSFSNSHFSLPEVNGAFLMQTDTTTVKLTENINGETWQVIRYPLALYPQQAGQMQIPAIGVRFSTSAGYGSTKKAFEFLTEPLELTVNLPPGAKEGNLIVTTTSFELSYDWQPESGTAQTGDAITLTVNRRADDISAMLLPPLPVFKTEGLAAYPQAPEVNDATNRGDLTGERTDSIIWVIEEPGTYSIPGIRFQWWDPASTELKQQVIPAISLDVLPSPTDEVDADTADKPAPSDNTYRGLWAGIVTVSVAILLWFVFRGRESRHDVVNEKSTFASLRVACRSNKAGESHSALHDWMAFVSPVKARPMTLEEFSRLFGEPCLSSELLGLQEALVKSDNDWQGGKLFDALVRVRSTTQRLKSTRSMVQLAPLNP